MRWLSVHAAWGAAPTRLLRTPAWCALLTLSVVLLVASFVAPPLFVASARVAALQSVLAATQGSAPGSDSGDLRVSWDGLLSPDDEDRILDRLADLPGWGDPTVGGFGRAASRGTAAVARASGRTTPAVLFFHSGALEALGADPDSRGIWLPQQAAADLGAVPGDRIRIGLQSLAGFDRASYASTVLAGTYVTGEGTALPASVADRPGAGRWVLPADPNRPGAVSPLAITSRSEFAALVPEAGERPLFVADLALDPDITPGEAERAVAAVARLGNDAFDESTGIASALASALPEPATLQLGIGLPDITLGSDATATSATRQVRPYAVAGQALAAGLLLAAWALVGRSRRREQVLASDLGVRPSELAGLAGLEVLVPCLVAAPLGAGLALLGVGLAGPPGGDPTLTGADLWRALAVAALGCLAVALSAGLSGMLTDRRDALSRIGASRRAAPWLSGVLVATAVTGAAVVALDLDARGQALLAVLFPVLVASSSAALVVRLRTWLVARRTRHRRPGSARWLAARRTSLIVQETAVLTTVLAVALGLFGYCLAVRQGIDQGTADKAAALSGSRTVAEVPEGLRGGGSRLAFTPPVTRSTVVWRQAPSLPPGFGGQPLLAVDVDSFRDVADWGATGTLDAGRDLLERLDEDTVVPPADVAADNYPPLPVILAGRTALEVGHRGVLNFNDEFTVRYVVVGVVNAFPGSEEQPGDVTVVTSARRLFALVPSTMDPRRRGSSADAPGAFASSVWADVDRTTLLGDLDDARLSAESVSTAAQERVANGLLASTWAASYLLALGLVVLVVVVAAAVVLALRLVERDRVSDALLARMGWTPGETAHSRWWEVVGAAQVAGAAATVTLVVLWAAPSLVDSALAIAPVARPRVGGLVVPAVLVLLGVVLVVARAVDQPGSRRRPAAEVLREET